MAARLLPKGKIAVYTYTDPRPEKQGEVFYVGKGRGRRPWEHLMCPSKTGRHMRNKINKIRQTGLEPFVTIVQMFDDDLDATQLEIDLIAKIGRRDKGLGPLVNLTDGGEGTPGRKMSPEQIAALIASRPPHSEETRKKISQTLTGRKVSEKERERLTKLLASPEIQEKALTSLREVISTPEYRAKMSAAMSGRTLSEDHKINLSKAHKGKQYFLGKNHSPETIEKMRQNQMGKSPSEETRAKISATLKAKPSTALPVMADGVLYADSGVLAKVLGVSRATISNRIKAGRYAYVGSSYKCGSWNKTPMQEPEPVSESPPTPEPVQYDMSQRQIAFIF